MARGENLPAPARLRLIDIRDAEGERALCRFAHSRRFSSHGNASSRPTIPP